MTKAERITISLLIVIAKALANSNNNYWGGLIAVAEKAKEELDNDEG